MDQMKNFVTILIIIFWSAITVRCFHSKRDEFFGEFHNGLTEKTKDFYYAVRKNLYTTSDYVCDVTRETPSDDGVFFNKTCPVKILILPGTHHNQIHDLVPLDHDYALLISLYWSAHPGPTGIHIIRMADCKVVELTLKNTWIKKVGPVSPDERTFDLIYNLVGDESDINCRDYFCKVTYNLDGELIHNATQYVRKPDFDKKESSEPKFFSDLIDSKFIYYKSRSDKHVKFHRVHQNGSKTEIFSSVGRMASSLSTANGYKLSVCTVDEFFSHVGVCKQYDSKDNDKVLMDFEIDLKNYLNVSNMYNLHLYNMKNGGLILVGVEIKGFWNVDNLKIIRVSKDGRLPSSSFVIPFANHEFEHIKDFAAVEDDTNICLKITNVENLKNFVYKRRIECIPKNKL